MDKTPPIVVKLKESLNLFDFFSIIARTALVKGDCASLIGKSNKRFTTKMPPKGGMLDELPLILRFYAIYRAAGCYSRNLYEFSFAKLDFCSVPPDEQWYPFPGGVFFPFVCQLSGY